MLPQNFYCCCSIYYTIFIFSLHRQTCSHYRISFCKSFNFRSYLDAQMENRTSPGTDGPRIPGLHTLFVKILHDKRVRGSSQDIRFSSKLIVPGHTLFVGRTRIVPGKYAIHVHDVSPIIALTSEIPHGVLLRAGERPCRSSLLAGAGERPTTGVYPSLLAGAGERPGSAVRPIGRWGIFRSWGLCSWGASACKGMTREWSCRQRQVVPPSPKAPVKHLHPEKR